MLAVRRFDADGHPTRITDANGVTTDSTYTPRGWLATRSVGGVTTTIAYTPYGAVASVTDPDGVKTSYTYDAAHRLTDITDAMGERIHYTLDAAGNKTKEQAAFRWRTWTPQALPAPSPTSRRRHFDRPQYNAALDC